MGSIEFRSPNKKEHDSDGELTMSADKKINYVELPAANLDKLEAFYSKSFGWTFTDYGPEYRAFSDGSLDGGFSSDSRCNTNAARGGRRLAWPLPSTRS